jgi:hypothetical protein
VASRFGQRAALIAICGEMPLEISRLLAGIIRHPSSSAETMKNHIGAFALLLPLALVGVACALPAKDDAAPRPTAEGDIAIGTAPAECSLATLHGTYLFAYDGVRIEGDSRDPFAVAGFEVYDGRGNMRSVTTSSSKKGIDRHVDTGATYTVNANCTGIVQYSDGPRYDLFIAPDGTTFVFIQTNPGTVGAGFEPRVTAQRARD